MIGDGSSRWEQAENISSKEALKWCHKRAEQGFADDQFKLGELYFWGKGVPQDDAEAVKWLRKAAEQGYTTTQNYLGSPFTIEAMLLNCAEFYVWFSLAAAFGSEDAKLLRDEAAENLTTDNLSAAQKRAARMIKDIQQKE